MTIIYLYAIKEELISWPHTDWIDIIPVCTGIGKVNAALAAMKAIHDHQPDLVMNVGTAGGVCTPGKIVVCNKFRDRDLHKVHIPGIPDQIVMPSLAQHLNFDGITYDDDFQRECDQNGICNTGDCFVTQLEDVWWHRGVDIEKTNMNLHPRTWQDAICTAADMEAFAEAQACMMTGVPFLSVKYITDQIGSNSVKVWEDKLADAREELTRFMALQDLKALVENASKKS
jgi:adenosylhomocysteine nucleosidase